MVPYRNRYRKEEGGDELGGFLPKRFPDDENDLELFEEIFLFELSERMIPFVDKNSHLNSIREGNINDLEFHEICDEFSVKFDSLMNLMKSEIDPQELGINEFIDWIVEKADLLAINQLYSFGSHGKGLLEDSKAHYEMMSNYLTIFYLLLKKSDPQIFGGSVKDTFKYVAPYHPDVEYAYLFLLMMARGHFDGVRPEYLQSIKDENRAYAFLLYQVFPERAQFSYPRVMGSG